MVKPFDSFDVFLLAYDYPDVDLRHEIHQAEVQAKVQDFYEGTLFAETNPFPWVDYVECCREALSCRLETVKAKIIPGTTPGSRVDTERLKAQNDIVTVIGQYTQLRKSGHRYSGICPLHDDRGPSLIVNADKQTWHCFGACNRGGDVIDFIMAANGCDFKQAAAALGGGR